MGLLDAALGMLGGNQSEGNDPKMKLVQAALSMLSNQQQGGGLQGLISTFQNAGLGEIVNSWISNGHNLPISAAQIQQSLGGGQLSELAQSIGLSDHDTAGHLAEMLPGLIDKLTPNGQLPSRTDINPAEMLQQFSSLFGNR